MILHMYGHMPTGAGRTCSVGARDEKALRKADIGNSGFLLVRWSSHISKVPMPEKTLSLASIQDTKNRMLFFMCKVQR